MYMYIYIYIYYIYIIYIYIYIYILNKLYLTKHTWTKHTGEHIPDIIYRTTYTRQNITSKVYQVYFSVKIYQKKIYREILYRDNIYQTKFSIK